jgi:hypothetical protein
MHLSIRRLPVLCAVVFAVLAPWGRAQDGGATITARTIPRLPYTITKSGHYILRGDLVFKPATGTALTIDAPNVTVDLGGRILTSGAPNDNTNAAVGVKTGDNAKFVVIRNGTVKGFRMGLNLATDRVLVERVNVWSSGSAGITAAGRDVEIRECHVVDTGHVTIAVSAAITGIVALLAENAVVVDCRVIDTRKAAGQQAIGINAGGLTGCSVMRNIVRNGSQSGAGNTGISMQDGGSIAVENQVSDFAVGIDFGNQASKYQDNITTICTLGFGAAGNAVSVGGNN